MKKILRDQSGMALPTVLGIMLVVAILATGMFYFSYNELNFSTINKEQGQAQYLAKAGVEIAAKAFPGVSGKFFDETTESGGTAQPVTATLYLHDGEDGEPVLNSVPDDNKGEIAIKVTRETREIENSAGSGTGSTTEEVNVWAYEAVATVDGSTAKAKGFTLPSAKANSDPGDEGGSEETPDEKNMYLSWVGTDGTVKQDLKDEDGAFIYKEGNEVAAGGITGIINEFLGTNWGNFKTYLTLYNGVVTVDEDAMSATQLSVQSDYTDKRIFIWAAPAIVVEPKLNLQGAKNVGGLAITANTIIFEDEVHLYAGRLEMRVGDLILHPMGGKAQVYFNDNVYLHIGSDRYKICDAGSVYEFTESVDMLTWANKYSGVSLGLSNWLRNFINDQHTGQLKKLDNPPTMMPTSNSLSKIIWE